MQHLNYCRQALTQFAAATEADLYSHFSGLCEENDHWAGPENKIINIECVIGHLSRDVKLNLPKNGQIIDDPRYKGVKSIGELKLPFDEFIIEFEPDVSTQKKTIGASKVIMIVTKKIYPCVKSNVLGDTIGIIHVWFVPDFKRWIILPPMVVYSILGEGSLGGISTTIVDTGSEKLRTFYTAEWAFGNLARPLLEFLNALACKNVHIEKSPAKATSQGKKVKAALPFDDYHYLTVDVPGKASSRGDSFCGSHRSPREHLRRGHIRRLESGPIWVNATVVNAGIGGKVGKSYMVRSAK